MDDAVLSLGYRPDAFIEAYPDDVCAGVRLHYAVEPEPLDTAGAIRFAADQGGIDEHVPGRQRRRADRPRRRRARRLHRERKAEGTIALTPVDDPSRYGVVPTDDGGQVEAFIEKPPPAEAPTNWINAGTYVLEPSVLDRIPGGRKVSIERETFPAMVDRQHAVRDAVRRLLGRRRHAGDLSAGAARSDRRNARYDRACHRVHRRRRLRRPSSNGRS